jgi:hypothetical protein
MRRINVKFEGETMIVSPAPIANFVDALISLAVAAVLTPIAAMGVLFAFHPVRPGDGSGSLSTHLVMMMFLSLFVAPAVIFIALSIRSLIIAISEPRTEINRITGDWKVKNVAITNTKSIERLKIRYTGLRGPSRYALTADLDTGRSLTILSTGYTGSKEELVTLSQMAADFTASPHLYVHQQ